MRLAFLLAISLLLALPAAAGHAQEDPCQANPSPVDAADPSIIVNAPTTGAMLTSPVAVTGQARTFESTVQVALFDSTGTELASAFGTAAAPEAGELGPFSIDISFSVTTQTEGCLWVFEDSAKTGEPINVVQVPVTLAAVTGLPVTGAGVPHGGSEQSALLLIEGLTLAAAGLLAAGRALAWPER